MTQQLRLVANTGLTKRASTKKKTSYCFNQTYDITIETDDVGGAVKIPVRDRRGRERLVAPLSPLKGSLAASPSDT